jgi:hypothetical protein
MRKGEAASLVSSTGHDFAFLDSWQSIIRAGMLWGLGLVMFVGYAAIGVLAVSGVARMIARKWKAGLLRLAFSIIAVVAAVPLMGALGIAYANVMYRSEPPPPVGTPWPEASTKARYLGQSIAMQMNLAVVGLLVGIVVGVFVVVRARRKKLTGPS